MITTNFTNLNLMFLLETAINDEGEIECHSELDEEERFDSQFDFYIQLLRWIEDVCPDGFHFDLLPQIDDEIIGWNTPDWFKKSSQDH